MSDDGRSTADFIGDMLGCDCSVYDAIAIEQKLFSKLTAEQYAAIDQWSRTWKDTVRAKRKVESERDAYREALERIAYGALEPAHCYGQGKMMKDIAKQALNRAGGGE